LKNNKLRLVWIIPNVFMYLMFAGFSTFVIKHAKELKEIGSLSIWVWMLLLLLFVCIFCSVRIRVWIKEGKM